MFWKLRALMNKREIHRIHIAHTLRAIALSVVSIYVPIYLLTLGYSLSEVIIFYMIFHISGLLFTLVIISPLINRYGLIRTLKLYYPIEILFYILLYVLAIYAIPLWVVAVIGGMATFTYWVPLNILLVKHTHYDKMGSDLATFFALPKIFKVVGPLIGAILVPTVGFWSVFVLAMFGLILSFIPLVGIKRSSVSATPQLREAFQKMRKRKKLFILEIFDNILEESEWFWGIYIFLIIGTLSAPGIAGSLSAIGGILFLLFVGKAANKNARMLILTASIFMVIVSILRIFVVVPLSVYVVTLFGSFVMTLFLVPYFSVIYRAVKNKDSEEFIILREIPTVFGRLIVFCVILFTASYPQYFFILPAIVSVVIFSIFLFKMKKI